MSNYDDMNEPMHIEEGESEEKRRDQMRFAAGMSDFFAVVLGVVVILALLLLIFSLYNWLKADISALFLNLGAKK